MSEELLLMISLSISSTFPPLVAGALKTNHPNPKPRQWYQTRCQRADGTTEFGQTTTGIIGLFPCR